MAKTFSSINDVAKYIKSSCNPKIIDEIEENGTKIMEDVTRSQVDGWSGDIFKCIGTNHKTTDSIELAWQDTGGWYSLVKDTYGNHMYAPWALENGKVWGKGHSYINPVYKPATTLEETSTEAIEKESELISMKVLKQKGFDVR